MRNYNFKAKYFLLTLLMSSNFVLASDTSNLNNTDQDRVHKSRSSTPVPYPLYNDSPSAQNWLISTSISQTAIDHEYFKEYKSFTKTTDQDWDFDQYPKNNQEKTMIREDTSNCRINNPLQSIKITFINSNQLYDIVCYFNRSFSDYLSICKTRYPHSVAGTGYVLRFKHDDKDPKVNFAPFRKLHKHGVLSDSIIDRILNFSNFKVMDFRTDFEYLQAKIEQLPISSNDQDQKAEQSSQPSIAGEDVLNIITNHNSRISNNQKRQTAYWNTIEYLRQHTEGSDQVILELCRRITDASLPFYKDALQLILISDFSKADGQLPKALQDLKVTPEKIYDLINFARSQKMMINKLNNELNQEQITSELVSSNKNALETKSTIPFDEEKFMINYPSYFHDFDGRMSINKEKCYGTIVNLLKITSERTPGLRFLNDYMRIFYNEGTISRDLPEALQNLRNTFGDVIALIKLICEQKTIMDQLNIKLHEQHLLKLQQANAASK